MVQSSSYSEHMAENQSPKNPPKEEVCSFKPQRGEQKQCTQKSTFFYGPKSYCQDHYSSVQALNAKKAFLASHSATKEAPLPAVPEKSSPPPPEARPSKSEDTNKEPEVREASPQRKNVPESVVQVQSPFPERVRPGSVRKAPAHSGQKFDSFVPPASEILPDTRQKSGALPDTRRVSENSTSKSEKSISADRQKYLDSRKKVAAPERKPSTLTTPVPRSTEKRVPPSPPAVSSSSSKNSSSRGHSRKEAPAAKAIEKEPAREIIKLSIKKNKWGRFEDPTTHFVFDRATRAVYGVQDPKRDIIYKLTAEDVEICREKGWAAAVKSSIVASAKDSDSESQNSSDEGSEEGSEEGSYSEEGSGEEDQEVESDRSEESQNSQEVSDEEGSWEEDWHSHSNSAESSESEANSDSENQSSDSSADDY